MELLRYNNTFKSITSDFETEGLNLIESRPWQLSYMICEGTKIIEIFDKFIWFNDLRVSPEAARVTRFNYDDYKRKAEPPEQVLEQFESFLYNKEYLNIWQNGLGFDIYIHNLFRKICGKKTNYNYIDRIYDTNLLGKAIKYTNPPQIEENKLLWFYKLFNTHQRNIKTNLKTLCADNEIQYDSELAHDGKYDIVKTFEVFKKQIWKVEI